MKRNFGVKMFISLVLGLGLCSPWVTAEEPAKGRLEATQKKCPIMGGDISKKVFADFEGKRVYFCCPGCIKKFQAEPRKFLQTFQQAGIVLEASPLGKDSNFVSPKKVEAGVQKMAPAHNQSHPVPNDPQPMGGDREGSFDSTSHGGHDSGGNSGHGGCGGCN